MTLDELVARASAAADPGLPAGWTQISAGLQGEPVVWSVVGLLDGRLFSVGGDGFDGTVRASDDGGRSWNVLAGNCPPRQYAAGAILGGQFWITGGERADDTWASGDGVKWRQAAPASGWGRRWLHTLIAFQDRLYLLGGSQPDQGPMGDVWVLDGASWELVKAQAFPPRYCAAGGVVAGQMVLAGGHDSTPASEGSSKGALAEALVSADGKTWMRRDVPWSPRWWANAAVLGDTLYLVGGLGTDGSVCRDVWATRDAITWTSLGDAPWTALQQFGLGVCGDYLVLIGGVNGEKRNREVWAFKPPAA